MNPSEHIGPKLKSISNTINQQLCKDGQELNLTSTQMHILIFLCRHQNTPIYQKDILHQFDLSNATVSGIIARLEAKEFVTCSYSNSDSRCKQIMITEQARCYHNTIQANISKLEAQIVNGFSTDEITMLHDFLNRMYDNLNK